MSIVVVILGLIWASIAFLYVETQRAHIRKQAEENPKSVAYFLVSFFDYIQKKTILREISFKRITEQNNEKKIEEDKKSPYISELHDFLGIEGIIEVRKSYSISIDITKKIPRKFIDLIGHPGNHLLLRQFLWGLSYFLIVTPVLMLLNVGAEYFYLILASGAFIVSLIVVIRVPFSSHDNGSVILSLQKIYYQPYVLISIDNRMIQITSSWGKIAIKNAGEIYFADVAAKFTLGLVLKTGEGEDITVLSYPRVLDDVILNGDELQELCNKLNLIIKEARKIPTVDTDS